jgi:peptidoglycan LD-endopeptidase LytH
MRAAVALLLLASCSFEYVDEDAPPPVEGVATLDDLDRPRLPPPPPSASAPTSAPTVPPPAAADDGLAVPVLGVPRAQLHDTYDEARSGGRVHEALDIMAPKGTPVVSAVDGTIAKLHLSDAGGLTIYVFDDARERAYYYAHLDAYAPGLVEGQRVRRGDVLGTVGVSGNAPKDAPHLHFAIFVLGPEKRWWEGTPVNPYPLLRG